MLTLDDLEHFNDRSLARLFAPGSQKADANALARLARIVACLKFCRDVPDEELTEGGLLVARRALKSVLRSQQRKRRLDPGELMEVLVGALVALGERTEHDSEPAGAAHERHAVEAEIEAVAGKLADTETCDMGLMNSLTRGEFEILPTSNLATLTEGSGKFAGAVRIDVDLAVDSDAAAHMVRVHLVVERGIWRWVAQEGCCMSRNGEPAVFLPPDDGVVQAILSGLALRSGRSIVAWAEAIGQYNPIPDAQMA